MVNKIFSVKLFQYGFFLLLFFCIGKILNAQTPVITSDSLKDAFKTFVQDTTVSSPASPVKVTASSSLESQLLQLLAKPEIISKFRGPQGPQGPKGDAGSNGTNGSSPSTSSGFSGDYVTWEAMEGQIDKILEGAIENPTEGLENRLDTSITTVNLTVSGNTEISGTLNVTGVISGNVNGLLNPGFTTGSVAFQSATGLAQDNANFFWDDTNNRLGLGTITPATTLDINGGTTFRGNILAGTDNTYDIGADGASRARNIYFGTGLIGPASAITNISGQGVGSVTWSNGTITSPAASIIAIQNTDTARFEGQHTKLLLSPTGAVSNPKLALVSQIETEVGNSQNFSSSIRAGAFDVLHGGSGTATELTGVNTTVATREGAGDVTTMTGLRTFTSLQGSSPDIGTMYGTFTQGLLATGSSANIGAAYGTYSQVYNSGTGGDITDAVGVYSNIGNNGGGGATIVNAYVYYANTASLDADTTNAYGLYINTLTGTNQWAIYNNDADAPIYSASSLGLGDTTPDYLLDVAGTLGVDGAATFGSTVAVTTSVSSPSIISTGALGITPAAGNNLNINLSTTGDLAVNTDDLYVDTSSGNVGIGTTSPDSLIHAFGGSAGSVSAESASDLVIEDDGDSAIQLLSPNTNSNNIFFGDVDDNDRAIFGYSHSGDRFRFLSAGGVSELMTIEQGGDIGIGTTNPAYKLEVDGEIRGDSFSSAETSGTSTRMTFKTPFGGSNLSWLFQTRDNVSGAWYLDIKNEDDPGITLKHDGSVGINQTAPTGLLEVRGHGVGAEGLVWGHTNPNFASSIGATSTSGLPFISFFGRADAANGIKRNLGGQGVGSIHADTSGNMYFRTAPSGTADVTVSNFVDTLTLENTGDVGIGTTNPGYKLHINSSSSDTILYAEGNAGSNYIAQLINTQEYGLIIKTAGTTGGHQQIYVTKSDNTLNFATYADGSGYLRAAAWTYGSDRRMKDDIVYLEDGLEKILALQPASFDYIDGSKDNLGFIAQDVQLVIPEAVVVNPNNGMLGLKTEFITPYLVKAVQELDAKIEAMTGDGLAGVDSIWDNLVEKFADAANGITEIIAGTFRAKDELCINNTCVNEDELKALLQSANIDDSPSSGNDGNEEEPVVEENPEEEPSGGEETPSEEEVAPEEEPVVEETPSEEPLAEETPSEEQPQP